MEILDILIIFYTFSDNHMYAIRPAERFNMCVEGVADIKFCRSQTQRIDNRLINSKRDGNTLGGLTMESFAENSAMCLPLDDLKKEKKET